MTSLALMPDDLATANSDKTYGVGPIGMVGWPPLKCSSDSTPVARVSQRVSVFRGSSASATQAIAEYQGSDHGATTIQAKVSAQVAATTFGTSGESRLYRYQASASISGGQANPIMVLSRCSAWGEWGWTCVTISCRPRQIVGEMIMLDASPSGL